MTTEKLAGWWPVLFLAVTTIIAQGGCSRQEEIDPGHAYWDSGVDTSLVRRGLDLLVVVDNGSSMGEEQGKLASSLFTLVSTLVSPGSSWPFSQVEDMRVAVTTGDLGLSWGGVPYEEGDGWPGELPEGCVMPAGDDGAFLKYQDASVDLGDGASQACPVLESIWAETYYGNPNAELPLQAACMVNQGADGCAIQQPLKAGVRALSRPDHDCFTRESDLLAVILVSDRDDCSIESDELFATEEIQDASTGSKLDIACGAHPEFLYGVDDIYQGLVDAKGCSERIFFAAIVGVPMVDACQGFGSDLDACLDRADMQLTAYQDGATESWHYENACPNGENTQAKPGRRYVELAGEHFGENGYVYSICNDDWSPAVEEIATRIATRLCED